MLPILLIHGYSTEGRNETVEESYGGLPAALQREIGEEADSPEVDFLPLTLDLTCSKVGDLVQHLRTTVLDVTLLCLPSRKVFAITRGSP